MRKYILSMTFVLFFILTGCAADENVPSLKTVLDPDVKFNGDYTVEEAKTMQDRVKSPYGVCTFNDFVIICDYDGHQLVLFNQNGEYQKSLGGIGSGKGEFLNPTGITAHDGHLYVLDSGNNRVQIFNSDFEYVLELKLNVLVHKQAGYCYTDIAVADDGTVYVTTDSIGKEDAGVYVLKDGKILKSSDTFVGYLAEHNGEIYAVNTLELTHTPTEDNGQSGKNALYVLNGRKMKKIFDLPDRFTPSDFIVSGTNRFFLSGSIGGLNAFSLQGEYAGNICELSVYSNMMYIESLNNGDYLITETGS